MAPPGGLAPPHLERYLLPTERLVVAVRRHPARLIEPVGAAVLGLLAAGWLDTVATGGVPVVGDLVWLAWAALVARAVWRLAEWSRDWFVATDQRLLLTYGLLNRKVAMMPLSKVTDLSYNRSLLGRLLGYGEFVLESAGQDQALRDVTWLPSPDVLYRRICAEIFDPTRAAKVPGLRTGRPARAAASSRTRDTEQVTGWVPQGAAGPGSGPQGGSGGGQEQGGSGDGEEQRGSGDLAQGGAGDVAQGGPASGLYDGTERPPSRWRRR